MKKGQPDRKPILECGESWGGESALPFSGPDGLVKAIRHAHYHYYKEVVMNGHPYKLYATKFVNGHGYHKDKRPKVMNEHAANLTVVRHLLENHRSIVESVFANPHAMDYMSIEARILAPETWETGTDQDEGRIFKRPPSEFPEEEQAPSFGHKVSLGMLEVIVESVNRIRMFRGRVGMEEFMSFLDGDVRPGGFVSMNNRAVAYFFRSLADCGVISEEWQHVIDKRRLIHSRAGKPLLKTDLSSALCDVNNIRGSKPEYVGKFDEMADAIRKLKATAHSTSNCGQ